MSIATPRTSMASDLDSILADLSVTKSERGFQISSSRTRGNCANVIETALGPDGLIVIPLLTKPYMAGIDDAAIRAAVNRYRTIVNNDAITPKCSDYLHFRTANADLISRLAEQVGEISEKAHWNLIDDMKKAIGSGVTYKHRHESVDQEGAIHDAESWVAAHCSSGLIAEDVSIAIWLKGQESGRKFLEDESQSFKEVHLRIDELSALANLRKGECSDWFVALRGGAGVDFLTPQERAELEVLKLQLPSSGLLCLQARSRIAKRIALRNKRKH